MKIAEVVRLLDGIAEGLGDISRKSADGLAALSAGMRAFSEQSVEQFVAFLSQCEDYRVTGVVRSGKAKGTSKNTASGLAPREAADRVRALLAEIDQGTVSTNRIDSLMNELEKAMKKSDLDLLLIELEIAGKAKSKAQAIDKIGQVVRSQLDMYVKAQSFFGKA